MAKPCHGWLAVGAVVALGLAQAVPAAEAPRTLPIGAEAPDFKLPGVDGKDYALKDFAAAKVLVVVFTCNHCPTAQAYEQRLVKLHDDYKDKGVALVAISPNDPQALRLDELGYTDVGDSFEDMKLRARERGFKFPYLYDGDTQSASRAYGVAATPHVFIFDAERRLRYVGRIDDSDVKEVRSHDARNAIEALLAGKPVPVETTRAFGCSTKWAAKREDARQALARCDAEPVDLAPIDAAGVAALAANDSKKLRLISVWAASDAASATVLRELVTVNRMYRKRAFEMTTICVDPPEKRDAALARLKELHVSSANTHYGGGSRDALAQALDKEWQGALPYTILAAPGGKVIYRKAGEIDPLDLRRAIVQHLGRTY